MLTPDQIQYAKSLSSPSTANAQVMSPEEAKASFSAPTQSPAVSQPSFTNRVSNDINTAGGTINDEISGNGQYANETPTRRGIEAGATAGNAVLQTASETLPQPARDAIKTTSDAVSHGFNFLTDKLSSTKLFSDIGNLEAHGHINPQNNPEFYKLKEALGTVSAEGQVAGDIAAVDQVAKAPQAITNTAKTIYNTGKNAYNALPSKPTIPTAKPTPPDNTAFSRQLNKAFPPNKRELALGDKRVTDAKTVFKDIASNTETNGIVDENGDVKAPKDYTFKDTMDAQDARMPQIYKDYTSKLQGIDKSKFDTKITGTVVDTMSDLEKQIAKENSVPDRNAMAKLRDELGGLRDTSPQGMQDYLQKLGQRSRALGGVLSQEQIQTANLAGKLKAGLDTAVTDTGDTGYSAARGLYAAHKTMQDAFVRAALKEVKATPGLMDKLTTLGVTGEGIQFLLTHNPASLVAAAGVKGASQFMKWLNSPQRALGQIYDAATTEGPNPTAPTQSTPAPATQEVSSPQTVTPKPRQSSQRGFISLGADDADAKAPITKAALQTADNLAPKEINALHDIYHSVSGGLTQFSDIADMHAPLLKKLGLETAGGSEVKAAISKIVQSIGPSKWRSSILADKGTQEAIRNHIISGNQILESNTSADVSKVIQHVKNNIVLGLRASGKIDAAAYIEKLDTKDMKSLDDFANAVELSQPRDAAGRYDNK